jgi:RsiW-degrading membrane proteinase PrsW (M82 family)
VTGTATERHRSGRRGPAVLAAAVGAGFASTEDAIEATNRFAGADATVKAFAQQACPTVTSG